MPVAEAAKEQELRVQLAEIKQRFSDASGEVDRLRKELGAALKEAAKLAEAEGHIEGLKAALAAAAARESALRASLDMANAKLDKAEDVLAAGRAIKDGLARLA